MASVSKLLHSLYFKYRYQLLASGLVSGYSCKPPDPHQFFIFPKVEEFYATRYQRGSFSLFDVGNVLAGFLSYGSASFVVHGIAIEVYSVIQAGVITQCTVYSVI